jgi:DNA-3-methyladenine glycosylase I
MSSMDLAADLTIDPASKKKRCWWCGSDAAYIRYHDEEWGVPTADDRSLFEKVCLEGFQSGLSWLTILRKREAFRNAFANFDIEKIARFKQPKVEKLLQDARIVRHRGKIESTINNARRALELRERQGSLAAFAWRFEPVEPRVLLSRSDIVAYTTESQAMSKELKKLGWSFVGPTTCYAFMQAMGMVNDHLQKCYRWVEVDSQRRQFERPG